MAQATTDFRPLSAAEQKQLTELMTRQTAGGGPAVRIGNPWQALANISLPRRGDPEKQTDLVTPGETVYLTDDEAAKINRRHPVPVLRPAAQSSEPLPRITGRQMSGRLYAPPPPPPGSDMPRPDPAGSSFLEVREVRIPEDNEPQVGSEALAEPEAVDIPPRPRPGRTRAPTAGTG